MNITIITNELLKGVQIVHNIAQKKNIIPVLSNILLEVDNGKLRLQTSDLDIDLQVVKECQILETGIISINAKTFLDVVKFLPGEYTNLTLLDNGYLEIKSGNMLAKLITLYPEDYPLFPDINEIKFKKVNARKLIDIFQKTVPFTSTDNSRYNMTGVLVEPNKLNDKLISTDGHRLSKYEINKEEIFPLLSVPILLPRKGLLEILKILETYNTDILCEFGLSSVMAVLKIEDISLCMRFMELSFPEYRTIIPDKTPISFIATRFDLINSLKRVSVLTHSKNQGVKLQLKKNNLRISCFNPDIGEIYDNLTVSYDGPDVESGFIVSYVLEALSLITDTNVIVSFENELLPVVLTGEVEQHYVCVVMPIYY